MKGKSEYMLEIAIELKDEWKAIPWWKFAAKAKAKRSWQRSLEVWLRLG